ncbi:MAG: acyl-CoA dehydrogenase family protein [Rubrivivax sp.]
MNFELTEEQRAFADSARALFADTSSDEQWRAHDTSGQPFMQALWRPCVDMGLHGIVVDEAHGGLGVGMTELMAVLEAQGRALALVPLWEHQLVAATVARFGSAGLASRVLAPAMAGDALLTLSMGGVLGAHGPSLSLQPEAGGWRLSGRVSALPLAAQASWALLGAACGDTTRLVLLDLRQPGVQRVEGTSQHHQAVADLHLADLSVNADAVLDGPAMRWFEPRAMACLAALQMGVTAEQLHRTVAYVSERRQFGRPVGSFQLVAGQMADGHIALEALRSALWQLVYRLDAGLDAQPHALATRVLACELGHRTGHMAQHVHGGMGVDLTYPIHRFLYWSRALASVLGGAEPNLARLGDWLADNDHLGWKYDLPEPDEQP